MKPEGIPVTIAQAAKEAGRTERTICRWITGRLISSWRTADGQRVVMLADVLRVERDQRLRTSARQRRRDEMLKRLRSVS